MDKDALKDKLVPTKCLKITNQTCALDFKSSIVYLQQNLPHTRYILQLTHAVIVVILTKNKIYKNKIT